MQTLRRFIHLTFFVLVWFVLSLTIASPIGKPQNILLVFSESDAPKVLVQTDHGSASEMGGCAMDLPYASPQIAVRHIARVIQNGAHTFSSTGRSGSNFEINVHRIKQHNPLGCPLICRSDGGCRQRWHAPEV